jgi:hypothetical protein
LLFKGRFLTTAFARGYDVSADGQRFLMELSDASTEPPVTGMHVILNWFEELKARVPTK